MTPTVNGSVAPRFAAVADAFRAAFDGQPTMGAALSVRHEGRPVVDLWAGSADERSGDPWERDTLSVIFSCTKGMMAILAARLVQDGLLEYDAPVARYWPEFAAAGKEHTRVADLLAHRAGLSAPRDAISPDRLTQWHEVVAQLAGQEPLWEPGTAYNYHAITHGWLIGEVVRRVTGLTVGQAFRRIIAEPLAADTWIGLPSSQRSRVAHMSVGSSLAALTAQQEADAPSDRPDWNGLAMTLGGALPRELVGEGAGFNDPEVQAAEIPGAGGISTARALAAIWSATVTETDGIRLLDPHTVDLASVPQSEGEPYFAAPPPWPRWGMGFQLDSAARRYLSDASIGHDGAGGQVAFADPHSRVGFAFLTNRLEAIDDHRATRIVNALRDAVA